MSLNATFVANFESFQNESAKAVAALASIQTAAGQAAQSATTMASSFTAAQLKSQLAIAEQGVRDVESSFTRMNIAATNPAFVAEMTKATAKVTELKDQMASLTAAN